MKRPKHKDPRRLQSRTFICPDCGTEAPASKWWGITRPGHIKTMWCYHCQKETEHIQLE